MPTYAYECDGCEHRFERVQAMSDDALTTCPECDRETLRRLIGAGAALVFKGSGFYINDYGKKGGEKKNGDGSGDGGSEAKSEAKPEKKSEGSAKSDSSGSGSGSGSSSGSGEKGE